MFSEHGTTKRLTEEAKDAEIVLSLARRLADYVYTKDNVFLFSFNFARSVIMLSCGRECVTDGLIFRFRTPSNYRALSPEPCLSLE